MDNMAMGTLQIRDESISTPLSAYYRAVDDLTQAVVCPRCESDVYSFGMNLEYFVGSIFLALADIKKGASKLDFTNLAMKQLDRKEKIVKINNDALNRLLQYFYDNGGPIIESPVDEKTASKIAPRFKKIQDNFFDKMEVLVNQSSAGHIVDQMEIKIDNIIFEMYTAMKALYKEDELRNAFDKMIRIRQG
jgi:hypothetical protein